MEINQIILPSSMIAELYASSLVETAETFQTYTKPPAEIPVGIEETKKGPKSLGENKKNILVAVKYDNAVHLPDSELQLLINMLNACKLSLADVAIINISNYPEATYKELTGTFASRVALLFDIEPAAVGLPMNFPYFQIQPFANCSFLYAPSLTELESDKVQKSKLWVALRRLFNI